MPLTWERDRYGRKVWGVLYLMWGHLLWAVGLSCWVSSRWLADWWQMPLPMFSAWFTCFLRTVWFSALTAKLRYLLTPIGGLWTRLGSTPKTKEKNTKKVDHRPSGAEEDDSELQRAWGALIKEKEQSRQKKSRLDSLPSLQIEVSRESSSGSEAESWCPGLGSCPQIWHSYIGWGTQ